VPPCGPAARGLGPALKRPLLRHLPASQATLLRGRDAAVVELSGRLEEVLERYQVQLSAAQHKYQDVVGHLEQHIAHLQVGRPGRAGPGRAGPGRAGSAAAAARAPASVAQPRVCECPCQRGLTQPPARPPLDPRRARCSAPRRTRVPSCCRRSGRSSRLWRRRPGGSRRPWSRRTGSSRSSCRASTSSSWPSCAPPWRRPRPTRGSRRCCSSRCCTSSSCPSCSSSTSSRCWRCSSSWRRCSASSRRRRRRPALPRPGPTRRRGSRLPPRRPPCRTCSAS
jgi:hypothetical protein